MKISLILNLIQCFMGVIVGVLVIEGGKQLNNSDLALLVVLGGSQLILMSLFFSNVFVQLSKLEKNG